MAWGKVYPLPDRLFERRYLLQDSLPEHNRVRTLAQLPYLEVLESNLGENESGTGIN